MLADIIFCVFLCFALAFQEWLLLLAGILFYALAHKQRKQIESLLDRVKWMESALRDLKSLRLSQDESAKESKAADNFIPEVKAPVAVPPPVSIAATKTPPKVDHNVSSEKPAGIQIPTIKVGEGLSLKKSEPAFEPRKKAEAPQPKEPAKPNELDLLVQKFVAFFTTGNVVLKVGVAILLIGVSFLLKYAADEGYFPIWTRMICVAAFGFSLVGIGFKLRSKNLNYALILQGTGVAILYLTTFSSYRIFDLLAPIVAFAFLILIVVGATALAVLQNAESFAFVNIIGAFSAPILISTGSGNHVALFAYYAIVNAGVVSLAYFKTWRSINVLGFVFTFGVGSIWGAKYYKPEFYQSVEPFLILFFAIYFVIPIFFTRRVATNLRGFVDATLVFGSPIIFLTLQNQLVKNFEHGLTITAGVLTILYSLVTVLMWRSPTKRFLDLREAFVSLAVVFFSLTILLAFDAQWSGVFLAIQGAGLVWIGLRQHRVLARLAGVGLLLFAGIEVLPEVLYLLQGRLPLSIPIFNQTTLGYLARAVSSIFAAVILYHQKDRLKNYETGIHILVASNGIIWLSLAICGEMNSFLNLHMRALALLVLALGFAEIFLAICKKYSYVLLSHLWFLGVTWILLQHVEYEWIGFVLAVLALHVLLRIDWNFSPSKSLQKAGIVYSYVSFIFFTMDFFYLSASVEFVKILNVDHTTWLRLLTAGVYFSSMLVVHKKNAVQEQSFWKQIQSSGFLFYTLFLILWFGGWIGEIVKIKQENEWLSWDDKFNAIFLFSALTYLVLEYLRPVLRVAYLSVGYALHLIFVFSILLVPFVDSGFSLHSDWRLLSWALSFGGLSYYLWRLRSITWEIRSYLDGFHIIFGFCVILFLHHELSWLLNTKLALPNLWPNTLHMMFFALVVAGFVFAKRKKLWPLLEHEVSYQLVMAGPLFLLGRWFLISNIKDSGVYPPLAYLPFLSPVDLGVGLSLCVLSYAAWNYTLERLLPSQRKPFYAALGVAIFVWVNAILARTMHNWFDVPYDFNGLYHSLIFQMTLSIYWCLLAAGLMIFAAKKITRPLWISGALLLVLVVLKLLFVDFQNRGTIERIVSAIVVGILFLIIGYFSPIPPSQNKASPDSR